MVLNSANSKVLGLNLITPAGAEAQTMPLPSTSIVTAPPPSSGGVTYTYDDVWNTGFPVLLEGYGGYGISMTPAFLGAISRSVSATPRKYTILDSGELSSTAPSPSVRFH